MLMENKEKPIKLVFDSDMTPAERLRARQEQLQNLREQKELKQMLANQDKVMYRISQRCQRQQKMKEEKKTPEEQIEDLRRKESDLLEKEYELAGELKKVTEYYESAESDAHQVNVILEDLCGRYSPQNGFDQLREDCLQNWQNLQESFEAECESLKRKKKEASEGQDQAYHERIRIAQSIEDKRKSR
ncbi:hypothetical protein ACVRXQ_11305 [Streptococcus panodentis]|uniref:Uncharacterized protein n=1 Tax=Streptococcus panodentis TaxID=1581472 RepID=A0ABS5AYQ8_9STRE|nr:hypothetical protein [Streptococcus panodentis]MBP2621718.1 hypothetical protein [Streptococcus panodentis]